MRARNFRKCTNFDKTARCSEGVIARSFHGRYHNEKKNYQPTYSPDGKEIAYIENRMTLKIYNIESKQTRTLLTDKELFSMRDNDQYFQWSPDSKWIMFDYAVPGIATPLRIRT